MTSVEQANVVRMKSSVGVSSVVVNEELVFVFSNNRILSLHVSVSCTTSNRYINNSTKLVDIFESLNQDLQLLMWPTTHLFLAF